MEEKHKTEIRLFVWITTPGNDYCNGYIQVGLYPDDQDPIACMCDCLHVDDLTEILTEKGLNTRPEGM